MATESSGTDFGVRVFKFVANINNIALKFVFALKDKRFKEYFENIHILISSEILIFLTTLKISFFFQSYEIFKPFNLIRSPYFSHIPRLLKL
jgi:hypothetical protein